MDLITISSLILLDNFFVMDEVGFDSKFSISCEKEKIFGNLFPYWQLPGTDYPTITELECVNALECFERPDLGPEFADSFDNINNAIDDTFEYYCNMKGDRGSIIYFETFSDFLF